MKTDTIPMSLTAYLLQYYGNKTAHEKTDYSGGFIFEVYTERCMNCGENEPDDGRAFCKVCTDNEIKQNTPLCNKTDCGICIWRKMYMDGYIKEGW